MSPSQAEEIVSRLKFDADGLIPAIVQDASTRQVLTVAYMSRETARLSLTQGETYFWSRSRQEIWHKGETSGNTQKIAEMHLDCDGDALLVLVHPSGPACHTGAETCFHHRLFSAAPRGESPSGRFPETVDRLIKTIEDRRQTPPRRVLHRLSLHPGAGQDPQEDRRGVGRDHHRGQKPVQDRTDRGERRPFLSPPGAAGQRGR